MNATPELPDQLDVSLIIACYNEEQVLETNLKRVNDILALTRYSYEIILIDDCSQDSTRQLIERITPQYERVKVILHASNKGRGQTVRDGILESRGEVVGFIDIDLETSECYLPAMIAKVKAGFDVVIAWRIYRFHFHSILRYILSRGYVFLVRMLLGMNFKDTEAGCKFFNRSRIIPVLEEIEDHHWFWDTEVMVRSFLKKYRICEMPTLFIRNREVSSTVRVFADTIYYLGKIFRFRSVVKELRHASS